MFKKEIFAKLKSYGIFMLWHTRKPVMLAALEKEEAFLKQQALILKSALDEFEASEERKLLVHAQAMEKIEWEVCECSPTTYIGRDRRAVEAVVQDLIDYYVASIELGTRNSQNFEVLHYNDVVLGKKLSSDMFRQHLFTYSNKMTARSVTQSDWYGGNPYLNSVVVGMMDKLEAESDVYIVGFQVEYQDLYDELVDGLPAETLINLEVQGLEIQPFDDDGYRDWAVIKDVLWEIYYEGWDRMYYVREDPHSHEIVVQIPTYQEDRDAVDDHIIDFLTEELGPYLERNSAKLKRYFYLRSLVNTELSLITQKHDVHMLYGEYEDDQGQDTNTMDVTISVGYTYRISTSHHHTRHDFYASETNSVVKMRNRTFSLFMDHTSSLS